MKIVDKLKKEKVSISFEFFPPKTKELEDSLFKTIEELKPINPTFVSVTYGAGGSTREKTRDIVKKIHEETNLTVMAHLTCVGHSKQEIKQILEDYKNIGIENILALRGDIPLSFDKKDIPLDGCKHAFELVSLIKDNFGDYFCIAVASYPEGHPESPNLERDIYYFKQKVEAGADFSITQMFFDNSYFYDFLDRCTKAGVNIPIIPGIMPITNFNQIRKFASLCGATIPEDVVKLFEKYADNPEETKKIGIEFATKQCEDLLKNGVKGLHFYTLNKSDATIKIYNNIKALL
ncbi:methylenetetrahydrofolate reductase [NAD(P)H] [Sulfurihydrogenibium azorense]|jgi:methylenetetrahydrofolate reductase (NADPH)|uniref:Methylenetetrahydrofolate reductase n=1 Tax=Sulfurihydrogenibium azorense (strain DSM 15241 / OCM 825 / Az-Fu1) TaxID=204536 RepID=C1DUH1_SULAA|nr:methylenetetrahydrofolate reductase [NAD(P)H] [Sulfurihydrogenibium azorense]ACN99554.1 5,10-methylenetetrahydrofolate reductase [Sulfurihydrogenibium azorense Az-Fu1]